MANRTVGITVTGPQYNEDTFDIGDLKWSARRVASSGWLLANGSAVSRTTYASLFAAIAPSLGAVTVTLATPGVFTLTAHGLTVGDSIYLTTTGALPTGLSANTLYYVVSTPDANTFTVSATQGGSAINTSGSQSGTHTLWYCPYGLGDGSTTFNLPDGRGRGLVGPGPADVSPDVWALGQNDGTTLGHRGPRHRHTVNNTGAGNLVTTSGGGQYVGGVTGGASVLTVGHDAVNDPLDSSSYVVANLFVKYA
jgi:microcystin-dependent protein